nr:hypothetical protein [Tanacetum cinerariifolium]
MRRVGKGFSGVETPLFETMLAVRDIAEEAKAQIPAQDDDVQEHAEEEVATDVVPPTPTSPLPSSPVILSLPPRQSPSPPQPQAVKVSSHLVQQVLDKCSALVLRVEDVVPPTPTSPLPSSPVILSSPHHQSPSPPQPQAVKVSSHLVQQVLDKCSALVLRVEGLENANAAQQLEIIKLKATVKKLERLNKIKSSKLRRLKKVGTSQRIESSDKVENVFNQGRISVDMETDEGVKLVVDQEKDVEIEGRHGDKQAEIYNIDLDHSLKVLSMHEDTEVQEAVEVVTTAKLITEVVTAVATQVAAASTQVAAASTPIPAAKPKILKIAATPAVSTRKRKRVVIRDPEEELHTDTPAETPIVKDKGKGILIEDLKPMKKKDQVEMDAEYAKKLQEELNKEHEEAYKQIDWNASFDHVQAKETQHPLAQKVPVVDYQVVVIDNKPRYKIIRADDTHQLYISFTTLLKNFDREDLETLWRIVKDRFSTKKPTNFSDE